MAESSAFGAFLQSRRHAAGLSARAVARELGLSHVAYGNAERGQPAVLAEQYWPALLTLYPDVGRSDLERLAAESEKVIEVDVSTLAAEARPYAQEIARSLNRLNSQDLHRLLTVIEGSDVSPSSEPGDECVPRVAPMSKQDLVELADELLRLLQPEALDRPVPIDLVRLIAPDGPVERRLGIRVLEVSPRALKPGAEAAASSQFILIRSDQWSLLHRGGPAAFRARATVAHELGHAVLHSSYLASSETAKRAALVPRRDLRAFEDPEWQAWTLAQAFLIPLRVARKMADRSPAALSEAFKVSLPFAEGYARRFAVWLER